jgi:hypothetical protein
MTKSLKLHPANFLVVCWALCTRQLSM